MALWVELGGGQLRHLEVLGVSVKCERDLKGSLNNPVQHCWTAGNAEAKVTREAWTTGPFLGVRGSTRGKPLHENDRDVAVAADRYWAPGCMQTRQFTS